MGGKRNDIAESHKAEWERIEAEILSNANLMAEIRALRQRYNLPCTTEKAHDKWFSDLGNSQGIEAILKYQDEILELAERYGYGSDKGKLTIRSLIEYAEPVRWKKISSGYPRLEAVYQGDNYIGLIPVIDADTALYMPEVVNAIVRAQHDLLFASNPPPRPQPMKNYPRKLDWRPLWEWRKRHPDITLDEIAKKLNYNPVTVRRKLAELDNGN